MEIGVCQYLRAHEIFKLLKFKHGKSLPWVLWRISMITYHRDHFLSSQKHGYHQTSVYFASKCVFLEGPFWEFSIFPALINLIGNVFKFPLSIARSSIQIVSWRDTVAYKLVINLLVFGIFEGKNFVFSRNFYLETCISNAGACWPCHFGDSNWCHEVSFVRKIKFLTLIFPCI